MSGCELPKNIVTYFLLAWTQWKPKLLTQTKILFIILCQAMIERDTFDLNIVVFYVMWHVWKQVCYYIDVVFIVRWKYSDMSLSIKAWPKRTDDLSSWGLQCSQVQTYLDVPCPSVWTNHKYNSILVDYRFFMTKVCSRSQSLFWRLK